MIHCRCYRLHRGHCRLHHRCRRFREICYRLHRGRCFCYRFCVFCRPFCRLFYRHCYLSLYIRLHCRLFSRLIRQHFLKLICSLIRVHFQGFICCRLNCAGRSGIHPPIIRRLLCRNIRNLLNGLCLRLFRILCHSQSQSFIDQHIKSALHFLHISARFDIHLTVYFGLGLGIHDIFHISAQSHICLFKQKYTGIIAFIDELLIISVCRDPLIDHRLLRFHISEHITAPGSYGYQLIFGSGYHLVARSGISIFCLFMSQLHIIFRDNCRSQSCTDTRNRGACTAAVNRLFDTGSNTSVYTSGNDLLCLNDRILRRLIIRIRRIFGRPYTRSLSMRYISHFFLGIFPIDIFRIQNLASGRQLRKDRINIIPLLSA